MLVLPLIPITALVIQNSVNMSTLQGYQTRVSTIRRQVKKVFVFILEEQVRGAMEIALFIQNIQEERAEVALYIFINQVGVEISAETLKTQRSLKTFASQTNTAHKPRDNMSLANSIREGGFGDSGNIKVTIVCFLATLLQSIDLLVQERFRKTDRALEEVPTWPNVGHP